MTLNSHLHRLASAAALLAALPAIGLAADSDNVQASGRNEKHSIVTVLYEGPLVHDQNWHLTTGPPGPDNQKPGGTCSMIPSDVHNVAGSGFERITFEAERLDLGVWKMAWTETVIGTATDGNNYVYRQRNEYTAPTNDGRRPRPNRAPPSGDNPGFLQVVPGNVNADSVDMIDQFVLQTPGEGVVASSHLHFVWRLQIPPIEKDPPPDFFPFLLDNKYIVHTHEQLAGQFGCDPL
ncbi:MAG TPA: hypothetical protein VH351_02655 [Bryobacteraceae bacterium]|nr:hypothetical protein [Bryobacteraceae bacterium]